MMFIKLYDFHNNLIYIYISVVAMGDFIVDISHVTYTNHNVYYIVSYIRGDLVMYYIV